MTFSIKNRSNIIDKLKNTQLDVLAIGGGITGAGVAIQAATDGLKTGLVEMQDFSEGTSSRSTKLVHGGIRYLKTFDIDVVQETVRERNVIQNLAPHLPRPAHMIMPIYDVPNPTFDMVSVKVALKLYDELAGVKGKWAYKVLDKEQAHEMEPALSTDGLLGAGVYLDFLNNDSRLVIENIKAAAAKGGLLASRVQAMKITHNDKGIVDGIIAKDVLTGEEFPIKSKLIINTSGPWSDRTRHLDQDDKSMGTVRPTKGVHLLIDNSKLNIPATTYFDSGIGDGRMIFVVPYGNKIYFGTTDTDYNGDYKNPDITQEDVDYLLYIMNRRYPNANLNLDDIKSGWSGLRPLLSTGKGETFHISDDSFAALKKVIAEYDAGDKTKEDVEEVLQEIYKTDYKSGKAASAVSRGSSLTRDDDGFLVLAGGKITDYRKMAAIAMDKIHEILENEYGMKFELKNSKEMKVSGGEFDSKHVNECMDKFAQMGIDKGVDKEEAYRIANLFGSNSVQIFENKDNIQAAPGLGLGETLALHYSIDNEMTMTPTDYLRRRTERILFQPETLSQIKQPIVDEMAKYLNWEVSEKTAQEKVLNQTIVEATLANLKK